MTEWPPSRCPFCDWNLLSRRRLEAVVILGEFPLAQAPPRRYMIISQGHGLDWEGEGGGLVDKRAGGPIEYTGDKTHLVTLLSARLYSK